jgi:cytochrome c biogenesis protein CcdA
VRNFRDIFNRFAQILGFVMVLVYATLGVVFLSVPGFYPDFKGTSRYILGILSIIYAIYRAYRIIKEKTTT